MKSYLAYIRVSTVKQGQLGSSLDEQKYAIEAYALRQQLSLFEGDQDSLEADAMPFLELGIFDRAPVELHGRLIYIKYISIASKLSPARPSRS